jgi:hypothetical protein
MITKLFKSVVVMSALAVTGLLSISATAGEVQDSGSIDAKYVKRDVQPIPDQEQHILMLADAQGTASNPGGAVDGFSVSIRETLDLTQGTGPKNGYVIFSKGGDEQVVKIDGTVRTVMKDGKPSTTFEGNYHFVSGKGVLAGRKGSGTYSGYFTAEDAFHVEWKGHASNGKEAAAKN